MPLVFLVLSLIGAAVVGIEALRSIPPIASSPTPTPTYTNSQRDNQENYTYPTPTVDPDPIIDCTTKSQGVIKLKRSICTASIDCLINGKYYLAANNDQCNSWVKQAMPPQQTYQQPPTYQYTQPQYTYPTYQTQPTSAPNNNTFNDCMAAVNSKRDACNQNCYAQRDTSGSQQYTGNNDPYLLCLDNCQTSNPYNCN